MRTETKKFRSAYGSGSRLFSMLLVFAMMLTLLQSLPAGVWAVKAATVGTELSEIIELGDSVQLQIDETTTIDLAARGNGAFGEAVNLTAKAHAIKVLVNGESVAESTITPEEACAVGIWVENGVLYDTVNNSDKVTGTVPALTGNFGDTLTLKKADGSTYTLGSWNTADTEAKLVYVGNGVYSRTFVFSEALTADRSTSYKITFGSWDNPIGGSGDDGNFEVTIPSGATEWTVYADTNVYCAWDTYNPGSIVYLRGDMNDWGTDTALNRITGTLYYLEQSLTTKEYSYKVDIGGNWDEGCSYPESNKSLSVTEDGTVCFLFDSSVNGVYDSVSDKETIISKLGLTTPFTSPEVTDDGVVFRYYSGTATSVALIGSMNDWDQNNTIAMTKGTDNVWTVTSDLAPGKYVYKFLVNGSDWITDPKNSNVDGDDKDSVVYVPGLMGATVTIGKGATKELPTALDYMNEDGTTTSMKVTCTLTETIDGVTFDADNNTIKVDSGYEGTTLTLKASTTETAEALTATVTLNLVDADDYVESPEINGKKVTFRYKDEAGTMKNVSIAGTVTDDWTIVDMTKDSETNIWSWTTELEPGEYEYKFIADDGVDGNNVWITDPMNDNVAESGNSWFRLTGYLESTIDVPAGVTSDLPLSFKKLESDGNTVTVTVKKYFDAEENEIEEKTVSPTSEQIGTDISLTAQAEDGTTFPVTLKVKEDTGKITVRIHLKRTDAADYEAWIWSDTVAGDFYDFSEKDENGYGVATYVIDNPRFDNQITFEVRIDDDWNVKDGGKRYIDISDVLSGTIDYYTESGASGGNRVLSDEALTGAKIKKVAYNRTTNKVVVTTTKPIYGDISDAFTLTRTADDQDLTIKGVWSCVKI